MFQYNDLLEDSSIKNQQSLAVGSYIQKLEKDVTKYKTY